MPGQYRLGALSAGDDAAGVRRRKPGAGDRPAGPGRRGHRAGGDSPVQRDRSGCLDPRWAGGRPPQAPPGGTPSLLSTDDEDFVVATATTRPTELGQPFTRWSIRKLAAYLRRVHGRVIRIGREALRCLLLRRGITFQRTKTWKEYPDPERDAKLDRIEQVLDRFPDRVFAFDEFGPLGIRPTAGSCWAKRGRPDRLPADLPPAPQASATSTAATPSATTACGASTAAARAPPTAWPRCSRSALPAPTAPRSTSSWTISPPTPARTSAAGRRRTRSSCASPRPTPHGPIRSRHTSARCGSSTLANSNYPNHVVQTRALHRYLRWRNANARRPDLRRRPAQGDP
ncbi:hypothetical protein SHIRM173S_12262 [Streptomyces hirsutus]